MSVSRDKLGGDNMNWTEQTESMMKMWNDALKQFSGGLNSGMPGLSGISAMPDLSNLMHWFKPGLLSGFPAWGGEGGDATTSQAAAGNLFATQAMMMQGLEVLTKAWQAISPSLSTGKPWQPDFDGFLRQWGDELRGAPGRFSATGVGMKDLMGSFLGAEWGPLLKPWLASIQGTGLGGPMGDMLTGGQFPLQKMLGMGTEPAFQDLAQIPMMGVNREQIAKISRAFDSHVDLRKAAYKYQTAMGKVIGEAMKETIEKLVELAKKDEQLSGIRELMRIWVKTTDKKLTQMYITEEFTAIQAEMSTASLNNKLAQRAVLEMILTQLDIPTRTELDDAYKTLYNLKKGVRELRTDTVDVRNAHKQAEAEMMELRNARKLTEAAAVEMRDERKRAESEAEKLRSTSKKLEAEIASLRDALQKAEAKFAKDLAKVVESAKTPAPVKVSPEPVKVSPEPPVADTADTKVAPKPASAPASVRPAGNNGKEPIKVIRKKTVS